MISFNMSLPLLYLSVEYEDKVNWKWLMRETVSDI